MKDIDNKPPVKGVPPAKDAGKDASKEKEATLQTHGSNANVLDELNNDLFANDEFIKYIMDQRVLVNSQPEGGEIQMPEDHPTPEEGEIEVVVSQKDKSV